MSQNRARFFAKAKRKIFRFKCTRGNMSTAIDETTRFENEIESKKALKNSPIQFLDGRYSVYPIKNQVQMMQEFYEEDSNISKLPILVFTPEKKRDKFTSTFADRPPIESFMTEDLTVTSPSTSSINFVNSQITDSLITNDTTITGTEFAFSNILYHSPDLTKRSTKSLISEDLTNFSSSCLKSICSSSSNFNNTNSRSFHSLTNNSGDIY
ncbi:hypothetical protein BpHYR1_041104 [Brachionus plicatilis]|uniref:Uncharacterized protein n=1 Tax=Brachionus plicatilis TaxID=10195 RepID=A0A3M7S447_BRAPC|nr:hypothetical protein BpHYR1_041104 [Brachionus plicatilis]